MRTKILIIISLGCMLVGPANSAAYGQSKSMTASDKVQSEQIQITADRLESSRGGGFVEFIGKVEVIQGQFEIRSDRLRVYYTENTSIENAAGSTDAIKRIVANGNVKIKTGTAEAQADQASYLVAETLLVLTGDNSTVTSERNFITGSKISLNRTTGKITVEGQPGKRVRAVLYPDKELQLTPEE